jgi:biopolymer transport protein ExbB
MSGAVEFLDRGGPVLWLIAGLSVATLAFILWKVWRLALMGAWSGAASERAVALWAAGDRAGAAAAVSGRASLRATLVRAAMAARADPDLGEAQAREETTRVAKAELARARAGLRLLDLVVTIAPLLGLLGTVIGMIAAFRTLQEAGAQADPVGRSRAASGWRFSRRPRAWPWRSRPRWRSRGSRAWWTACRPTWRTSPPASSRGAADVRLRRPRIRRRISLTPMIDVVFLLLVFFMLAARFGQDQALPLAIGTGARPGTGRRALSTWGPRASG